MSLAEMMKNRVARYADRRDDWTVFRFETAIDPTYARRPRRYIGALITYVPELSLWLPRQMYPGVR